MNKKIPICISAANRIINRTNAQNSWRFELGKPRVELTARRLQKILYLCQLFWYIDHEECNMIPEDFQAWPNGPVIPEIYDYWMVYQDGDICPYPYENYTLSKEEADIINIVVDNTVDIPTEAIIGYTQLPYGPWAQAYKAYKGVRSVISKDSIKQYIRRDDVQRELIDFINNESTNKEPTLVKKLTPQKDNDNK